MTPKIACWLAYPASFMDRLFTVLHHFLNVMKYSPIPFNTGVAGSKQISTFVGIAFCLPRTRNLRDSFSWKLTWARLFIFGVTKQGSYFGWFFLSFFVTYKKTFILIQKWDNVNGKALFSFGIGLPSMRFGFNLLLMKYHFPSLSRNWWLPTYSLFSIFFSHYCRCIFRSSHFYYWNNTFSVFIEEISCRKIKK